MAFLLRLIVNAVALWFTVVLGDKLGLPLHLRSAAGAVIAVIVLAIVNATIGALLKLITLPLRCLTLGLLTFVINALLFWLVGTLDLGFYVGSFWAGLFGSIVYSILSSAASQLIPEGGD